MPRRLGMLVASVGIVLALSHSSTFASDNSDASAVQLTVQNGTADLRIIKRGVHPFADQDCTILSMSDELAGLTFTCRDRQPDSKLSFDAPAGTTVYILVGSGPVASNSRHYCETRRGWTRVSDLVYTGNSSNGEMATYKCAFTKPTHVDVPQPNGMVGIIVVSSNLKIVAPSGSGKTEPSEDAAASGAGGEDRKPADAVNVSFSTGDTVVGTLSIGAKPFTNRDATVTVMPPELNNLSFTSRVYRSGASAILDAPAGATVYCAVGTAGPSQASRKVLETAGGTRVGDFEFDGTQTRHQKLWVYRLTFAQPSHLEIPGGGGQGLILAASNLTVAAPQAPPAPKPAAPNNPDDIRIRPAQDNAPMGGSTVRIANPQATIKILSVMTRSGKELGGEATDFILTVTPGSSSKLVTVNFITPIGNQMAAVTDDVLRYIHVKYPNWYADKAEVTFADRAAYDGPSIGAAIGTLILSAIEGFQIDDQAAITGDIAANGVIHAIGGLSYKLHGAAAAGCTVVAVPMENFDNIVDAVIYKGPSIVTDVQVIGMANLDDAVAVMRADRDSRLAQAISLFAAVQQSLKADPHADVQSQLRVILNLAPKHLSAKVLLMAAEGKLPKTLSPTASLYYTDQAVETMLPILDDRAKFSGQHPPASSIVRKQLDDLKQLRPIADPEIQPFIDAWSRFIWGWSMLEAGQGSSDAVNTLYQRLEDESAKLDADPDLNQKLLNEGM